MGTARDSYLCWEGHAHNICVCASACMRACTHRSELGGSRRWFSFACGQLFFLHLQVLSVWDNTSTPSLTKTPHKEPRAGGCVLFNATVRCRPKTWIPGDPARFYVHQAPSTVVAPAREPGCGGVHGSPQRTVDGRFRAILVNKRRREERTVLLLKERPKELHMTSSDTVKADSG